jgi:predicted DNA-binding ribbon-helix-helix protein
MAVTPEAVRIWSSAMGSPVIKRSVLIARRRTSVSLEDRFWNALKEISMRRAVTISALITQIDNQRQHANLSSCLRLFVLDFYIRQSKREDEGAAIKNRFDTSQAANREKRLADQRYR